MKKRQKTKKSQGKISWFLRSLTSGKKGQSSSRKGVRQSTGVQKSVPSSTKVGAGDAYRLRSSRRNNTRRS